MRPCFIAMRTISNHLRWNITEDNVKKRMCVYICVWLGHFAVEWQHTVTNYNGKKSLKSVLKHYAIVRKLTLKSHRYVAIVLKHFTWKKSQKINL